MKTVYNSLEELVDYCRANNFTSTIPYALMMDERTKWRFVSGFADEDNCHAVFISCPSGEEPTFRITWKRDHQGEGGHIEVLSVA